MHWFDCHQVARVFLEEIWKGKFGNKGETSIAWHLHVESVPMDFVQTVLTYVQSDVLGLYVILDDVDLKSPAVSIRHNVSVKSSVPAHLIESSAICEMVAGHTFLMAD